MSTTVGDVGPVFDHFMIAIRIECLRSGRLLRVPFQNSADRNADLHTNGQSDRVI